jgi:tungstate transport system substrate-binding protein
MTRRPRRSSSPKASASSARKSCTTTSSSSAPRPTRPRRHGKDILEGLRKIEAAKAPFVSRGDKSGTHAAELRYWKAAGVDLDKAKRAWYRDTGSGMGPALNTAASMNAYILADRGTWLNFKNRAELGIVVEGDTKALQPVWRDPGQPGQACPCQAGRPGQQFIDWLVSPAGQQAIADYKIGGEQLFFPNAKS